MNFKGKLMMTVLGGAMLALPTTVSAPAFAQSSYERGPNLQYVQPVDDWWWDRYGHDRDGYANHGWHRGYYTYRGQRNPCERARGLEAQVWQDRKTGHPAAAQDVQEEANAARAACYNRE